MLVPLLILPRFSSALPPTFESPPTYITFQRGTGSDARPTSSSLELGRAAAEEAWHQGKACLLGSSIDWIRNIPSHERYTHFHPEMGICRCVEYLPNSGSQEFQQGFNTRIHELFTKLGPPPNSRLPLIQELAPLRKLAREKKKELLELKPGTGLLSPGGSYVARVMMDAFMPDESSTGGAVKGSGLWCIQIAPASEPFDAGNAVGCGVLLGRPPADQAPLKVQAWWDPKERYLLVVTSHCGPSRYKANSTLCSTRWLAYDPATGVLMRFEKEAIHLDQFPEPLM